METVAKLPWLFNRNGRYIRRARVPADPVEVPGPREAGVPQDRMRLPGGWAGSGVDANHGSGPRPSTLAEEIAKIRYPGIGLTGFVDALLG